MTSHRLASSSVMGSSFSRSRQVPEIPVRPNLLRLFLQHMALAPLLVGLHSAEELLPRRPPAAAGIQAVVPQDLQELPGGLLLGSLCVPGYPPGSRPYQTERLSASGILSLSVCIPPAVSAGILPVLKQQHGILLGRPPGRLFGSRGSRMRFGAAALVPAASRISSRRVLLRRAEDGSFSA